MVTLIVSAFMIVLLNPSVAGVGSYRARLLARAAARRLPRHLRRRRRRPCSASLALTGLIASFHTILYAQGRQIYSLSRAGYFPTVLSVTHRNYKTPHVAMIVGAIVGLAIMLVIWFAQGARAGRRDRSAACCSTWRCSARCSPTSCRRCPSSCSGSNQPHIERPYRQPARHSRRRRHHRHRGGDAALPGPGPELLQGRDLGAASGSRSASSISPSSAATS